MRTLLFGSMVTIFCLDSSAQEKKPIDPFEKRFILEFKNATWRDVFEKLSDQTGMPYASPYPAPPGKFTYTSKGKKLSLMEAIDTINDVMVLENHVLIRRDVTITMLPLDALREFPGYIPRSVRFEDLHKHQKHIPVRTTFRVRELSSKEAVETVRQLLGESGYVTDLEDKTILVMASPQLLRIVHEMITALEMERSIGNLTAK